MNIVSSGVMVKFKFEEFKELVYNNILDIIGDFIDNATNAELCRISDEIAEMDIEMFDIYDVYDGNGVKVYIQSDDKQITQEEIISRLNCKLKDVLTKMFSDYLFDFDNIEDADRHFDSDEDIWLGKIGNKYYCLDICTKFNINC